MLAVLFLRELKVSGTFSLTSVLYGCVLKSKIGSCESGEWFFTCAFLFATSPSYEGGEKRTTAKKRFQKSEVRGQNQRNLRLKFFPCLRVLCFFVVKRRIQNPGVRRDNLCSSVLSVSSVCHLCYLLNSFFCFFIFRSSKHINYSIATNINRHERLKKQD